MGVPFRGRGGRICFLEAGWKEEYYVILVFVDHGQDVSFGLRRDADQKHIKKSSALR